PSGAPRRRGTRGRPGPPGRRPNAGARTAAGDPGATRYPRRSPRSGPSGSPVPPGSRWATVPQGRSPPATRPRRHRGGPWAGAPMWAPQAPVGGSPATAGPVGPWDGPAPAAGSEPGSPVPTATAAHAPMGAAWADKEPASRRARLHPAAAGSSPAGAVVVPPPSWVVPAPPSWAVPAAPPLGSGPGPPRSTPAASAAGSTVARDRDAG